MHSMNTKTAAKIFEMIKGGKLCACKILEKLNITQPTLSHHMKILCDCGLVIAEKDWKWTHYSTDKKALESLVKWLEKSAEEK